MYLLCVSLGFDACKPVKASMADVEARVASPAGAEDTGGSFASPRVLVCLDCSTLG